MIRLDSKQLRRIEPHAIAEHAQAVIRQPIVFILENIYDTYNIGGLFRLADGLGASKIYLCGDTEIPPNNRIHKASCGTYKIVPWEYCDTAKEAIAKFRSEYPDNGGFLRDVTCPSDTNSINEELPRANSTSSHKASTNASLTVSEKSPLSSNTAYSSKNQVIAIEQSPTSLPYTEIKPVFPLALVVGNESFGVTKETLDSCDATAEIPMWGINKSLNVIVSAGIVSYHFMNKGH